MLIRERANGLVSSIVSEIRGVRSRAFREWEPNRGARNAPYAGGFTTERYGKPLHGIHALQIELNRALYMDEATLAKKRRFTELQADLAQFAARMAGLDLAPFAAVL